MFCILKNVGLFGSIVVKYRHKYIRFVKGELIMKGKKIIAALCAAVITLCPLGVSVGAAAKGGEKNESADYTLSSPYENVNWDTYTAYKGNLHTHSSVSDGSESFRNMIYAAYEQNYDLLAFAEHGITGRAWNEQPFVRPLYLYQIAAGYDRKPLSNEEFEAISNGTAKLKSTGEARGKGLFCVTGANELNSVTLTKSHVNGYFLPSNVGNAHWGSENGYEQAIALVEKNGGLSHINHPGDWLESANNIGALSKEENVEFFGDLLLRYKSCLGVEAVNGFTSTDPYDRVFWDNLLTYCLPYGKTVLGFAGADAHTASRLNGCCMYFMMEDVSMDSLRSCMESGAFFGATHTVVANDIIGPSETLSAPDGVDQPLAKVESLTVSGHKINLKVKNADYVQWIANGKVISKTDVSKSGDSITLDLDEFDTDSMLYVRCEAFNENGLLYSQPIVLQRENVKQYKTPTGFKATMKKIDFALKSTRLYVIVQELVRVIAKKLPGC